MRSKAVAIRDGVEIAIWMTGDEEFRASGRKKAARAQAELLVAEYKAIRPSPKERDAGAWAVMTRRMKAKGWQVIPVRAFRRLVH